MQELGLGVLVWCLASLGLLGFRVAGVARGVRVAGVARVDRVSRDWMGLGVGRCRGFKVFKGWRTTGVEGCGFLESITCAALWFVQLNNE